MKEGGYGCVSKPGQNEPNFVIKLRKNKKKSQLDY